jgi:hypothetical protein
MKVALLERTLADVTIDFLSPRCYCCPWSQESLHFSNWSENVREQALLL